MSEEKSAFKGWYEKNKVVFNEARKARYRKDKNLRESILQRQREYRAKHPRVSDGTSINTKEVNGRQQEVKRIGGVAKEIGRIDQVIRLWEVRGIIPKPTVKGVHRYYTLNQISLLKELVSVMDEVRYKPSIRQKAISKKSNEVFERWEY